MERLESFRAQELNQAAVAESVTKRGLIHTWAAEGHARVIAMASDANHAREEAGSNQEVVSSRASSMGKRSGRGARL